jgi:hypothetical protein
MFRKILPVIILIALLLVTAGCGNEETVVVEEDLIRVEVTNSTEDIIISWAAFFGPGLDEWGTEMLEDNVIEPGNTFVFEMPEGEYDLALFTYEYYIVHNEWAISESIEIEVGGDGKVPVAFVNQSEHDVIQLFMSPTDSDDWGNDWTGDQGGITAETGGWIFFVEPGNYDIMIIQTGVDEPVVSFDNVIDERRTIFID